MRYEFNGFYSIKHSLTFLGHGVAGPRAVCGLRVDVSDRVGDAAAGNAEQVGESLHPSILFSFVCKVICLINEQNPPDQLGRRGCGGLGPRLSWRAWWRGRSGRAGRGRGRGGQPGHSGNSSSRN